MYQDSLQHSSLGMPVISEEDHYQSPYTTSEYSRIMASQKKKMKRPKSATAVSKKLY